MTNRLPEYLFAVTGPDGAMLGHIAYAPGLFDSEDRATMVTRIFFTEVAKKSVFIRSLPIEGMINDLIQVKRPTSFEEVLVDVLYANDCCVRIMAELPLESHIHDAGLRCPGCGTTFRFVWDDQAKALVWKWRTETSRPRRDQIVKTLAFALSLIKESENSDGDGEGDGGEPTATALRDLANSKEAQ